MRFRLRCLAVLIATTVVWAPSLYAGSATVDVEREAVDGANVNADPVLERSLRRFLPAGSVIFRVSEDAETASLLHLSGTRPAGPFSAQVLTDGTVVRFAHPVDVDALPSALRRSLLQERATDQVRIERVWLMAYELEHDLPSGSQHELFVDPMGHSIFEVTKPPEQVGDQFDEELRALPAAVRDTVAAHLYDSELIRLQREIEWGHHVVHAAKWRGPGGVQEVKILNDGLVLFVELPLTEPVPTVVRELADRADIEVLLLEAWSVADLSGSRPADLFLSTGQRIHLETGPSRPQQ